MAALACTVASALPAQQPYKRPEVPKSIANAKPTHFRNGPLFRARRQHLRSRRTETMPLSVNTSSQARNSNSAPMLRHNRRHIAR